MRKELPASFSQPTLEFQFAVRTLYGRTEIDVELDRDVNAAINIVQKVGQGMSELTPVEMFVGTSAKQDASVL